MSCKRQLPKKEWKPVDRYERNQLGLKQKMIVKKQTSKGKK